MKKNTKFKVRMAAAFSMGAVTALSFNAFYAVKNVVAEEMSTEHVIKESNYIPNNSARILKKNNTNNILKTTEEKMLFKL